MNGLIQILAKIEEDNLLEVNKIKDDAKNQAEKIMADAEAAANAEAEVIIANADKKTSQMLENAKSGCDVLIKRAEVSAKSEVVADCIKAAAAEIKAMADEKYFEVIKKLILKYHHHNEDGVIAMNAKDVARMPKKFIADINKEISKNGAKLVICDENADIDSGFIICYGGVVENCTFDSLIEEKKDEIKDKLYIQLKA